MKAAGTYLILAAIVGLGLGLLIPTTVDDTYNIGLMQRQLLIWNASVGLMVAGILVVALGAALDRLSAVSGVARPDDATDAQGASNGLPSRLYGMSGTVPGGEGAQV